MFTNININDESNNQYKYVIEYIPNLNRFTTDYKYYNGYYSENINIENILFHRGTNFYIRHHNHWYNNEMLTNNVYSNEYLPEKQEIGLVKIYFPQFSVDTYSKDHKYALTLKTWICGKCIVLGEYIISRCDSLACPRTKTFFNESYYEYIELPILDPVSIIYSDDWQLWRENICGESIDVDLINSVGSNLYCSLHPIELIDEDEYIKSKTFVGGQGSIKLFDKSEELMSVGLTTNVFEKMKNCESPSFKIQLNFNKYYNGSLKDYLLETYGIRTGTIRYELIIGDSNDLFAICTSPELDLSHTSYIFDKNDIEGFENGLGWKPGINIIASVDISYNDDSVISVKSNSIPLTENILRFFIKTDFYDEYNYQINNVNLDDVNMNILNINVVNKNENKIVKIDRVGNNKANIYQPVFYKALDSSLIVIHPEVNENVCINLDQYKHLVKSFILQIEGIKFAEIGRVKSGVLFKVFGSKLPKKNSSGRYYILNQDSEMVTGGKYIYEL